MFELMYMLEEYRIIITSIYSCLIDREQEGENVDDWHSNMDRRVHTATGWVSRNGHDKSQDAAHASY